MTAQELKNSILQMAIQGKLVKQDPNDEPASVLLDKIKEERDKLIKEKKIKKEKYSEIYKDPSDNHYYEKFEDGTINDITEEIPFEIPESWRWVRFNYFSNLQMGNTILQKDMISNGIPVYSATISDKILGYVSHCKYLLYKKDIVIPARGNSIGNATIIKDEKATCTQTTIGCKLSTFLNHEFIFYCCYAYKKSWFSYMGSAIPQITINNTYKNLIAIPPFKEQNRIVKKIEEIFPHIEEYNKKYTKLEKLNNNYKNELKKSILQYAIQGKLVKQNTNDEPAQKLIEHILDEKRKLMKEKKIKKENLSIIYKDSSDNQFYEKFDDNQKPINIQKEILFELPSGWEWTRLRNIGIYKKGPFGSALTKNIFVPKGKNTIKVYEQKNAIYKNDKLGDYYITEKYFNEKMKSFEVKTGDIIVSCAGTIGETYILPENIEKGIINQALMRMNISNEINIYYFLLYFDYVLKRDAKTNSKGSAIKNIPPFNIFKEYLIPIPPAEEQERIIKKLNKFNSIIETAE